MRPSISYLFYAQEGATTLAAAVDKLDAVQTDYFALIDQHLEPYLNRSYLEETLKDADLLHCGKIFGTDEILNELQTTSFSWFFLNAPIQYSGVSWKASPELIIIKKSVWKALGGFNPAYKDERLKVMDFAYRSLRSGGRIFYDPDLLKNYKSDRPSIVPKRSDLFLFVYFNLHQKAAATILFYSLTHSVRWISIFGSYRYAISFKKPLNYFIPNHPCWSIVQESSRKTILQYSAIIPTLNRYDYLPEAINSLLRQDFPPAEIIVYDQTDRDKRDESFPLQFDSTKVKFVFSDQKGQASARNNAIKQTTHDWCLLFDDDSVAMPDMATEHKRLLENGDYLVSTGASLAPGQVLSDLPYAINFYHLADVLDTGNLFIHKNVFENAGYLDLAFDKGPGVDNDFGTHLYRSGFKTVFNPKAVRIHYKASTGGLRTYGVWSRATTTLFGPFPPPSQTYTIKKYYDRRYWNYIFIRYFIKAGQKNSRVQFIILWILLPFKLLRSIRKANQLMHKFSKRENTSGY